MKERTITELNDQELEQISGGTANETGGPLYKVGERIRFTNVIAWDPNKTKPETLDGTILYVHLDHPIAGGIYKYFYDVEYEYEGVKHEMQLLVEQAIICSLG